MSRPRQLVLGGAEIRVSYQFDPRLAVTLDGERVRNV
jgi:hypothetical protein